MDISIITASIGSFVLSERVIKVSQLVGARLQSTTYGAQHSNTTVCKIRFHNFIF